MADGEGCASCGLGCIMSVIVVAALAAALATHLGWTGAIVPVPVLP